MQKIALLSGMLLFAVLAARPAAACSCMPPPPPREALEQATAVFSGRVVETARDADGINEGSLFATFEVERVWKGQLGGRVVIGTPPNSAMCGFHFEEGKPYLVYAYEQDGALHTNICTRTKAGGQAAEDLAALGEGTSARRGLCGGLTNAAAAQAALFVLLGLAFLRRTA